MEQEPSDSLPPGGSEVYGKSTGLNVRKSRIKFPSSPGTRGVSFVGFYFLSSTPWVTVKTHGREPISSRQMLSFLLLVLLTPPFQTTAIYSCPSACAVGVSGGLFQDPLWVRNSNAARAPYVYEMAVGSPHQGVPCLDPEGWLTVRLSLLKVPHRVLIAFSPRCKEVRVTIFTKG